MTEIERWIIEQARAGLTGEHILQTMALAGWNTAAALDILKATLDVHLGSVDSRHLWPMPEPHLTGTPQVLNLGDRIVPVLMTMMRPRVVVLGDFLSDEECDALITIATPRMGRSLTVDSATGSVATHKARTSAGMFFRQGETDLLQRIEARIAALVNWPVDRGEGLQVLLYPAGAEYKPHYDYFDPNAPGTASTLLRGGQRVGTVVMYLNDPLAGGGTSFPDVGLVVAPKRGNAVFFSYPTPSPCTMTLHGGAPVLAGEKWVATKWLRQRVYV